MPVSQHAQKAVGIYRVTVLNLFNPINAVICQMLKLVYRQIQVLQNLVVAAGV